jgi:hypothetical protein
VSDEKKRPVPEGQAKPSLASSGWSVAKRVARITLGIILILVGLAALLTPLTPGSWLAVVGLELVGLRVLLRKRLCAWAAAKPQSRIRRAACRISSLDGFEAVKRRWRQRKGKPGA